MSKDLGAKAKNIPTPFIWLLLPRESCRGRIFAVGFLFQIRDRMRAKTLALSPREALLLAVLHQEKHTLILRNIFLSLSWLLRTPTHSPQSHREGIHSFPRYGKFLAWNLAKDF